MTKIQDITFNQIQACYKKFGFRFFHSDVKNYNVNLWGIRSEDLETDEYNDVIGISWQHKGKVYHHVFKATTDPGLYYMKNPMSVNGSALMVHNQQYQGALMAGKHNPGKPTEHQAFRQIKPMKYWRDNDRNNYRDVEKGKIYEAIYYTNLHSRQPNKAMLATIGKTSAGCQVVQSPKDFHSILIPIRDKAVSNWGPTFTYTLFFERDIKELL